MVVQISQQDYADLKKQGFTQEQIDEAVVEIEKEDLQESYNSSMNQYDPRANSQQTKFMSRSYDDLVRWQLELNDILERAEHILRGDIVQFENGHMVWKPNKNPEENPLNEKGVQRIMKVLSNYINRNTILSDYTQDEINYKVYDFGREVNNLVYMKSEEFGMDTDDKRKEYPMIIREIVDVVHSAYKRALLGGERRSLREMIQISQNTSMNSSMPMNSMQNPMQPQTRGMLNPMRYIKGKYV